MSKIFKRPMFRKGGPTNGMTGIMSGIQDRQNYAVGTSDVEAAEFGFGQIGQGTRSAEEFGYDFDFAVPTFKQGPSQSLQDLTKQYQTSLLEAAGERGGYDPLTTFLLQYGPSLATTTGGSLVRNLVAAADKPLQAMLKEKAAEDKFQRGVRLQATGKAIETKEAQDKAAMEIQNKLEIAKADVINKGKELQNKIYANKELTDAERDNLLTELAENRRLALEKIDKQYEGQLELEKFKLENKETKPDPEAQAIREVILTEELGNYSTTNLAKRATDFRTTEYEKLYGKVGNRAADRPLTFDISDENQRKQNENALKELRGKVVYDPFSNVYRQITKDGFKTFNTIEEIDLTGEVSLDTGDKGGLTDEEKAKIKERFEYFTPDQKKKIEEIIEEIQEKSRDQGFGYGIS